MPKVLQAIRLLQTKPNHASRLINMVNCCMKLYLCYFFLYLLYILTVKMIEYLILFNYI